MLSNPNSARNRERNSAFELLRLLAIFFIILSHSSIHGGFPEESSALAVNNIFLDYFVLGNLGVDIFIIISGYFLSAKENPRKALPSLWAQVIFYSLLCALIYKISGFNFSSEELKAVFMPASHEEYWFFTAYMVLVLLSPYLNRFINSASQKELLGCTALMILLWSIFRQLFGYELDGKILAEFVLLYLMGAYLRKYPDNILKSRKFRLCLGVISFTLLLAAPLWYRFTAGCGGKLINEVFNLYARTSPVVLCCTLFLFSTAQYGRRFSSPWINLAASCSFGIYLLHDNPFIRNLLWGSWLRLYEYYNSALLIPRILFYAFIIFAASAVIELLRKLIFEKPFIKITDLLCSFAARVSAKALSFLGRMAGLK